MQRRQFIKSSCNLCLLSASGFLLTDLAACTPAAYPVIKPEVVHDQVGIPLASFGQSSFQLVRPKGWYYDIAVRKVENNEFEALLLECTHQQNQLFPTANGYKCNLHGSQYSQNGIVTKGPAENPLKKYDCSIEQDQLIIHLKK